MKAFLFIVLGTLHIIILDTSIQWNNVGSGIWEKEKKLFI
jgi:hypothetical protein